ncbi:carbohydrate ABC transporter permease [Actinospica sp.]|jgi:ABC-type glycerol-3-phosphate transport system permease component|uniref:carbohydrate ABC transporter permease n=1 Tax=Actinospica sp. TaxID=1872142 RepID=UPI002BCDBAEF|nr:carbohydrate ABC transporter permease [Actinospica sp.]HWG23478.1 carbohydrate ABC transporter permease [Actinospica sp.]
MSTLTITQDGRSAQFTVPRRRSVRPASVGRTVLLSLFVLVSLFPFYWIVITSFKTNADLARGTHSLLPTSWSWSAYKADFSQYDYWHNVLNSAIVAVSTTAITIVVASAAGYALARTRMRGRPIMLGFILVAGFFPVMAMVGPLFLTFTHVNAIDSFWTLILSYLVYTLPIAIWFLANFFSQIPVEIEEAAVVDGLTRFRALFRVIVPVAMPGVLTAAILSFILAWNDFTFALSFMQTPSKYTAPLAINNLGHSQFQVFPNMIDAAVVVVTIPIALLVLMAQRRIVSGFTSGSTK